MGGEGGRKKPGRARGRAEEEGEGKEEAEEGLGLVSVDRETMVRGVQHFGERDEMKEHGGDGGGDGDMSPAGAVIQGGGQNRERGYAVEEDRDSEPEEGHSHSSPAAKLANLQYIGLCPGKHAAQAQSDASLGMLAA